MKTGTTYDRLYRAAHALGNSGSALVDGRHAEFVDYLDEALGLLAEVVRGSDKLIPQEKLALGRAIQGLPPHPYTALCSTCGQGLSDCLAFGCFAGANDGKTR